MSDHLPECPLASDCKHDYYDEPPIQCADCGEECICDRLRACEQRVREEYATDWQTEQESVHLAGLDLAYRKGVQAARDAVAAVDEGPKDRPYWIDREAALAAVDALRGEA